MGLTGKYSEARQFEREFLIAKLKDCKKQKNGLKNALRSLESEIKELEYQLMNKVRGGNKELKINGDFKHIFEK